MSTSPPSTGYFDAAGGQEVDGRYVVVALLALGLAATATVFWYWDQHTKPFRPLTVAIGQEFKGSLPKVLGGKLKKQTEMNLRIAMRVPFDPAARDDEAKKVLARLIELTRKLQPPAAWDRYEYFLLEMRPELGASSRTFQFSREEFAAWTPELAPLEQPAVQVPSATN